MKRFFKSFFNEKCPTCNKNLVSDKTNSLLSIVIKSCPDNHFQKEYHPALETYVESNKVS
ncbi:MULTISPECIES: hypothetical protein [Bacillaceae]|uniref:Uncharacterized protein n=3 Tax=Bacillaceae TaxID=186817 RepID=A0A0J1I6W0_NIACI|nr:MULTISPECIES: hypothetical protein [Bacillaceae]EOR22191.1 hypothetical protein A499_19373 [Niallia nealsonii AAU1]MDU1845995.1 hypothetical protein [Niallia nealsonii]PMC34607.1 hypothetical protein CJ195_22625 [Bacillus sp. UMB0899]SLL35250.1 Uncharacterised protein [Mycobacteroides abscessus subsp. abscessus]AND43069.1 hypothetical protein A361_28280 [Cytobacillus oceanisediminis 2691]